MLVLWLIAASVILLTVAVFTYTLPGSAIRKTMSSYSSWSLRSLPQGRLDSAYVDTITQNQSSTFRIFYYIKDLPRTSVLAEDTPSIAPNLNPITDNYDICDNTNGACTTHKGFIKLLQMAGAISIELLQAPDASRPNLPKTQVCIQTVKNTTVGNTTYIETFPLPSFPIQKWVMLTISRQGHRFDIYYNDTLQASVKTTNAPYFTATNASLADTTINGTAKYPMAMSRFSRPEEVRGEYLGLTNTKGEPYDSLFPTASLPSLCPSGDCFSGPRVRPANPLLDWKTDFM